MASRRGEKASALACWACGAEYLYSTLLSQIAGAIIRDGDCALQDSEQLRKRLNALGRSEAQALAGAPRRK